MRRHFGLYMLSACIFIAEKVPRQGQRQVMAVQQLGQSPMLFNRYVTVKSFVILAVYFAPPPLHTKGALILAWEEKKLLAMHMAEAN
jgi:hypothetical protein